MMRASAVALTLATSGFAASCLPLGPAPSGKRLLDDGTAYQVQFVPGPAGTAARLVTAKITNYETPGAFSLYAVHEPADGQGLGTETFLIDQVEGLGVLCTDSACPQTDGQGRLFVPRDNKSTAANDPSFNMSLARVDPVTNEAIDFGAMSSFIGTFQDRAGVAYRTPDSLRIRDASDQETLFDDRYSAQVVNDELYFLAWDTAGRGTLQRLGPPPFDTQETVATDLTAFTALRQDQVLVLTSCSQTTSDTDCSSVAFDPVTGQRTALPQDGSSAWSASPSGRYLLLVRNPQAPTSPYDIPSVISLFDLTLGVQKSTTIVNLSVTYWPPGRDELWLVGAPLDPTQSDSSNTAEASFWRWQPGMDPEMVLTEQLPFSPITSDTTTWPFTPDGRYLLTVPAISQNDKPTVSLRATDDPATELLALNPTGTGVQDVRQLPDGRLIVSDWITDGSHADIYLVDPDARTMRPLGHGGKVVATGATRILALLDWVATGGSGSLSLIDVATGATTLLAENVHTVAVEQPVTAGGDVLAPGTRVAYVARNRVASPYDGLWLTSLP
ncbi:MAG TPA: hypothetical protein VGP07_24980 [Polyangia bacterium]|jgi:hypothetical protein